MLSASASSPDDPQRARSDSVQSLQSDSVPSSFCRSIKSEDLECLFGTNFRPSPDLIKAIEAKQCIAFVGAGFTAPITQLTWKSLLTQMLVEKAQPQFKAKGLDERYLVLLQKLRKDRPTVEDFVHAAQEMQDIMGERPFEAFIVEKCKLSDDTPLKPDMVHRIRCLSRIPFKAIITTNYNSVFCGLEKNVEPALCNGAINACTLWEDILRRSSAQDHLEDDREDVVDGASSPMGDQDSDESMDAFVEIQNEMTLKQALAKYKFRCPILKLHGCVEYPNSFVLSRSGYKRLQYETPGLKMFITSAMATHTVLYIGFSFTDDYLNEFRAEVLKMLRPAPRPSVQFSVVLQALKHIKKPHLLSHFLDKDIHDEYLQEFKASSSEACHVRGSILAIEGIDQVDCDGIETFVKEKVPDSHRRPCDIFKLDQETPIAYAIIDGKSQQEVDYARRHEALQMMTWQADGWFGGLNAYLDGILRQTSRPFIWGNLLTKNVLENGNKVIITWDLGADQKKKIGWWLQQCVEFYRNASRHEQPLYAEAQKRLKARQRLPASPSTQEDSALSFSSSDSSALDLSLSRSKSACDMVVAVESKEDLRRAVLAYKQRVACVICPFGLSNSLAKTENPYDPEMPGRWEQFMQADHIVRLVHDVMKDVPPQDKCPFIVYANPHSNKIAHKWRHECAMRCGAFGYACRTDKLFELLKSVTDVYSL